MRVGLALFWIFLAAAEIYRRVGGELPQAFSVAGPWFVVLLTLLPLLEAVRAFREGERLEGSKSGLWAFLGVVTLLFGPPWLRFGGR